MITDSIIETSLRRLEDRLSFLERTVTSVAAKAGQAYQNSANQPPQQQQQAIFNCITTTAVTARSGTTMGSGSFQFVDSTGGTLTTLSSDGTYTGYTDSSAGWATGKYGRVTWMNGHWEFITADSC